MKKEVNRTLYTALAIMLLSFVIIMVCGNIKENFVDSMPAPFDTTMQSGMGCSKMASQDTNELFLFQNTECSPKCCPSELSCDKGCVCLTPEQKKQLMLRGYNRSNKSDALY